MKISDGKRQCDDAIRQVEAIKRELQSKLQKWGKHGTKNYAKSNVSGAEV